MIILFRKVQCRCSLGVEHGKLTLAGAIILWIELVVYESEGRRTLVFWQQNLRWELGRSQKEICRGQYVTAALQVPE